MLGRLMVYVVPTSFCSAFLHLKKKKKSPTLLAWKTYRLKQPYVSNDIETTFVTPIPRNWWYRYIPITYTHPDLFSATQPISVLFSPCASVWPRHKSPRHLWTWFRQMQSRSVLAVLLPFSFMWINIVWLISDPSKCVLIKSLRRVWGVEAALWDNKVKMITVPAAANKSHITSAPANRGRGSWKIWPICQT